LTATLHADFAGVELYFSAPAMLPVRTVRFFREDGAAVRSGSPARAIGNAAMAYDAEMLLGVVQSWYAVPEFYDGSVGAATELVTLTVPAPGLFKNVWLKSVTNPNLAVRVQPTEAPEFSYSSRQELSAVFNSPFPAGSWDVWQSATSEWVFHTRTVAERRALHAVLTSGVVFLQTDPSLDIPDAYVLPGDVSRSYAGSTVQNDQLVSVSFTEVERPPVEGAALFIPGRSWQFVDDAFASWDAVDAAYGSWKSLANVG